MVVFIHYKTHERDGVSIGIEKRTKLFKEMGFDVGYITGQDPEHEIKNLQVIPELHFNHPEILKLRSLMFSQSEELTEEEAYSRYSAMRTKILLQLHTAFKKLQPELVFVHNMFSHGYNLPASSALTSLLDLLQIPTVSVNHDFWFQRQEFSRPQFEFVQSVMDFMPPNRKWILEQQTVNSATQTELVERRGIKSKYSAGHFNFDDFKPQRDTFNTDIRRKLGVGTSDILVLQANRVSPRKNFESSLRFCHRLQEKLRAQAPVSLGSTEFTSKSRVVLLISNSTQDTAEWYVRELKKLSQKLEVKIVWGEDMFGFHRKDKPKRYSIQDAYFEADLVMYPSVWERFGGQLLEVFAAERLPVIFEYPVFIQDVKPLGFEYVSLGNKEVTRQALKMFPPTVLHKAVDQTIGYLKSPDKLEALTSHNLELAQKHYGIKVLKKQLKELVKKAEKKQGNKVG